jgi:hypothetical protein
LGPGAAAGFSKFSKLVLITVAVLSVLNLVGIDLTAFAAFGGANDTAAVSRYPFWV